MGDNEDVTMAEIEVYGAMVKGETLKTGLINKIKEPAVVSPKETFSIIEEEAKIIHIEADIISGVETTPITMTGTIGIEILMVKVILIGQKMGQ